MSSSMMRCIPTYVFHEDDNCQLYLKIVLFFYHRQDWEITMSIVYETLQWSNLYQVLWNMEIIEYANGILLINTLFLLFLYVCVVWSDEVTTNCETI